MAVITIMQDQAVVLANTQEYNTPWISFPAEFKNAQVVVQCKGRISGTLGVTMQATWDTDSASTVGSTISVNAVGTTLQDVSTGLGPMVRFNLEATTGDVVQMISIYLTTKSE
jgi:hypothetical protein